MTVLSTGGVLCAALAVAGQALAAQAVPPLRTEDRLRLAEVVRLSELLRGRLWPGWQETPAPVLLVTETAEYLVGHPRPTTEFRPLGRDCLIGREVLARGRVFSPALLATFPAVGGVPTAVVGTAEHTGKTSAHWVLAVLHEQFHQWQYAQPWYYPGVDGLGLSRGDTTGAWMLDYPFPYDREAVQSAAARLARTLAEERETRAILAARRALGDLLTADEERYLEFQLWQEGVARWVELAAARAAARAPTPSGAFRALPDYVPYAEVAAGLEQTLREELLHLRLGASRRVAFYPLGAALAKRLDTAGDDWKRRYAQAPFSLDPAR